MQISNIPANRFNRLKIGDIGRIKDQYLRVSDTSFYVIIVGFEDTRFDDVYTTFPSTLTLMCKHVNFICSLNDE